MVSYIIFIRHLPQLYAEPATSHHQILSQNILALAFHILIDIIYHEIITWMRFSWFVRYPNHFRTHIIQLAFEEIAIHGLHLKSGSCQQMFHLKSKDTVKRHGISCPRLNGRIVTRTN